MSGCSGGQPNFYHVVNAAAYPGKQVIAVLEVVTGHAVQILDEQAWSTRLASHLPEHISSYASEGSPKVTEDFVALASAVRPDASQAQPWLSADYSTAQLCDRLRRLNRSRPHQRAYSELLHQLDDPDITRVDQALAVSLKRSMQEAKRIRLARTSASSKETSAMANAVTTVVRSKDPTAVRRTFAQWMLGTSSATFLSIILYALLGSS